jgi:anti-sigma factor RsiW
MTRDDFTLRLHAYADGELDAAEAAAVEAHLETCAACRAELAAVRELKAALQALDFSELAPEGLSAGIRNRVARARARAAWTSAGGGLLAACLAGALFLIHGPSPVDDAVRHHAHAAMAMVSGDRGQVKPWLAARLGFAPPVLEKAADCTLLGARTDTLAHKAASAVTYSCDGHRVDFYAVADRGPDAPLTPPRIVKARDVRVVTWQRGRLTCYAVSDAPAPRLLALASYIQNHAAEG